MASKKLFWIGFAFVIMGFFYYKMNYESGPLLFLPASPWIGGFISFFHMNPEFAKDLFKTYLGLAVGSIFAAFVLTIWKLK